jgi:hypothetical protein
MVRPEIIEDNNNICIWIPVSDNPKELADILLLRMFVKFKNGTSVN